MIEVRDPNDGRLDSFRWKERQLTNRRQRRAGGGEGLFLAEGDLVVERCLRRGHTAVAALCSPRRADDVVVMVGADTPVYVASDEIRRTVTGLGVPLEVVALFRRPEPMSVESVTGVAHRLVVLEAVDNPTNLGSVTRSAVALGWDGLLLDATSADPLARRALRVSMGAAVWLSTARLETGRTVAEALAQENYVSVALTPDDDATPIDEVRADHSRIAIVIGSERDGLSPATLAACTHRARIPMAVGLDSLNLAAAAAIALHHFSPMRM